PETLHPGVDRLSRYFPGVMQLVHTASDGRDLKPGDYSFRFRCMRSQTCCLGHRILVCVRFDEPHLDKVPQIVREWPIRCHKSLLQTYIQAWCRLFSESPSG